MMLARIFAASRITSGLRVSIETGMASSVSPERTGYAPQLLLGRNRFRPRSRQFATNIDKVCADIRKCLGILDCRARLQMIAAIREAVGCDVYDAHDARAVHRKAGNGSARGGDTVEKLLDSRLVMAWIVLVRTIACLTLPGSPSQGERPNAMERPAKGNAAPTKPHRAQLGHRETNRLEIDTESSRSPPHHLNWTWGRASRHGVSVPNKGLIRRLRRHAEGLRKRAGSRS